MGTLAQEDQFPEDARELGMRMRTLRGRRTLRDIEQLSDAIGHRISRTVLSRYERGQLPPMDAADILDGAYEASGYIRESIIRLRIDGWDPWEEGTWSARMFAHTWPARLQGMVWVHLRPGTGGHGLDYTWMLRWGPWRQTVASKLYMSGLYLSTAKAVDAEGVAATITLTSSRRVFAIFGSGEPPDGGEVIDVSPGWVRAHE